MDFYDVIYGRHSVRSYTSQALPEGTLEELLKAAVCAPSAHNAQPWHFVICTSQGAKERLMEHTAGPFRRTLGSMALSPGEIEKRIAESYTYFTNIPALIIAFSTGIQREDPRGIERILALQSVSAAITQLLLAAQAEGLGGCWYSLPLHCADEVREAVGARAEWEPVALIAIGYADGETPRRQKRPLNEMYTVL